MTINVSATRDKNNILWNPMPHQVVLSEAFARGGGITLGLTGPRQTTGKTELALLSVLDTAALEGTNVLYVTSRSALRNTMERLVDLDSKGFRSMVKKIRRTYGLEEVEFQSGGKVRFVSPTTSRGIPRGSRWSLVVDDVLMTKEQWNLLMMISVEAPAMLFTGLQEQMPRLTPDLLYTFAIRDGQPTDSRYVWEKVNPAVKHGLTKMDWIERMYAEMSEAEFRGSMLNGGRIE